MTREPERAPGGTAATAADTVARRPFHDSVAGYVAAALAPNTRRGYATDWHAFATWAAQQQVDSLPAHPATVARYLAAMADAGYALATIERRGAAIARVHRDARHHPPLRHPGVQSTLEGIRRTIGGAPDKKRALSTDDITRMLAACRTHAPTPAKQRDAAVLLIGYAAGLRRSELVGLDLDDLNDRAEGLELRITHSKGDQHGRGRSVGIVYGTDPDTCPVRAARLWINTAALRTGPLLRPIDRHGTVSDHRLSARSVARLLKRWALAAGLDPTGIAGHSLRSGHATTAAANGAADRAIMATTGHKDRRTLDGYIHTGQLLHDPSSKYLGL